MPLFSVIIPTYNRAERLKKAIDSVVNQEFEDWELIIIDDGSTDNTKEVVRSFNDERIRYEFQENRERGAARNKGVSIAEGEYVFFLDSDDIIYPKHLKTASELIKELDQPEFLHLRYEEVSGTKDKRASQLSRQSIKKIVLRQNQFACQFFLRKDIAEQFPFSENRELKIGEDWEVVLKIAVRYPLHFSNEIHSAIVQHEDRSMQLASVEMILKSRDILLENLRKDEKVSEHPEIFDNIYVELTSFAALSAAKQGQKKESKKLWKEASRKKSSLWLSHRYLAIKKHLLLRKKNKRTL